MIKFLVRLLDYVKMNQFCKTFVYLQLTLGLGVYAGMYLAQNYDVPKVDNPTNVYEKFLDILDDGKTKVDDIKKKAEK